MWIIIGVAVVAVVSLLWWSRLFSRDEELGTVSGQWLADYRQNREL